MIQTQQLGAMPVTMSARVGGQTVYMGSQAMPQTMPQVVSQSVSQHQYVPQMQAPTASTAMAPAPKMGSTASVGGGAAPMLPAGQYDVTRVITQGGVPVTTVRPATTAVITREQALDQQVQELKAQLAQKDKQIQDLQAKLAKYEGKSTAGGAKAKTPLRTNSGEFRKLTGAQPAVRYAAADQDDPVDVRLEEFYNSTGSAVPFRRINRGFYRFGQTVTELDIINHKLMARTEDGWNRGKFGPIEKFIAYYENIERRKAGIEPEST
mmetsp:Transcript_62368/g.122697  ORF Transcript_62368/g.122697 Transcript_62368/m.122697 type:complete len:266 (+) Transcript_62368:172-969(+)